MGMRSFVKWAATVITVATLGALYQANVQELAKATKADQVLVNASGGGFMSLIATIGASNWTWLVFGFAVGIAASLWFVDFVPQSPRKIPTLVRFEFQHGLVGPRITRRENIYTHYSYWIPSNLPNQAAIWVVVLVFKKPVDALEFIVDGGPVPLPFFQVRHTSVRHLFVDFQGDLSGRTVEISAKLEDN